MAILRRLLMMFGTLLGSHGAPGEAYWTNPTAALATQSAEQKPGTHSSPGPGPRRSCVVFRPSRGTCTLGRNALRLFLSSSLATSSAMGAASVGLDGCDAFI